MIGLKITQQEFWFYDNVGLTELGTPRPSHILDIY